jgi:hypothetical protein
MISFLSILAVGLFLGMRHATDPDHVIAVNRQLGSVQHPVGDRPSHPIWLQQLLPVSPSPAK